MQNGDLVRIGRRRRRARRGGGRALQKIRNGFLLLCAATIRGAARAVGGGSACTSAATAPRPLCAAPPLGAVALFAGFVNTYEAFAEEMPELDDYRSAELAQTSTAYDADGESVATAQ